MTPDQLAKSGTEHGEQRALFQWCNVAIKFGFSIAWQWAETGVMPEMPAVQCWSVDAAMEAPAEELNWLFAVPNGGLRDKITAAKLRHEGVKPGVPDLFLPLPFDNRNGKWAGLFIEMKRDEKTEAGVRKATRIKQRAGSTSDVQDEWIGQLRRVGYAVAVCFDWRAAAQQLQSYVEHARG